MSKHIIIWQENVKNDDNISIYSQDPSYVVVADKTDLMFLKNIDQANQPGIYILLNDTNRRYIGQASGSVLSRLTNHEKNKSWWNRVVFFGRDDGKLDKSQLDFLEKKLIRLFSEAGFSMDNGDNGNKSFIEAYQIGKAESLWENTIQILEDTAHINLFKKSRVKSLVIPDPAESMTIKHDVNNIQLPDDVNDDKWKLNDNINGLMSSKSLRQLYTQWVRAIYNNENYREQLVIFVEHNRTMFYNEAKRAKQGWKMTEEIAPNLHLMVNLSAKDTQKRVHKIAEALNIEIEVIVD